MAEFAASIIAFIQLTDTVIRVCSHVIGTAKDAPRDMIMISGEVTSLRAILTCFTDSDEPLHPNTEQALPTLFSATGPIQGCYQSIVELENLLPKNPSDASAFKRLTWALKEGQIKKLLAQISLHKSTLLLALTGDMVRDIKEIKSGVKRVEESLSRNEFYEVLGWLERNCHNPSGMHLNVSRNHEPHTNKWLDRWDVWGQWMNSTTVDFVAEYRFIWIYGIPGAGKSVMASFIIERIKIHVQQQHCGMKSSFGRLGYSYYYCHYSHNNVNSQHNSGNNKGYDDHDARKEDTAYSYLRWTINQLCRQIMWAPTQLKELHENGCDPSISDILSVLALIIDRFDLVYLVADGIDESETRSELLTVFKRLVTEKRFQKVRLLVTSRPSLDIEKAFEGISANISMSNEFVQQDIKNVVDEWVLTSAKMKRWGHLSAVIREKLCAGAQGMFRYAACQMQIIERVRTESQLYEALKNLPRDLDEIYTRELERIPEDDRLFVRRALIWILGHMGAPWMTDQGIYIDLLVDAICDDLRHLTNKSWYYTSEDLKELLGCLITTEYETPDTPECYARVRFGPAAEGGEKWNLYSLQDICSTTTTITTPTVEFVKIAHFTVLEFLRSSRIAGMTGTAVKEFYHDQTKDTNEFTASVLRQALAVKEDSSGIVDWIRDRETYCLTLAPAICINRELTLDDGLPLLKSLFAFFNPKGQHVGRLRRIQSYTFTGKETGADCFLVGRLPMYCPGGLEESVVVYERNDANAWAILGMITTYNHCLAKLFLERLGWDYETLAGKEMVVSFLEAVDTEVDLDDNEGKRGIMEFGNGGGGVECGKSCQGVHEERLVAEVLTYRGTLEEIVRSQGFVLNDLRGGLGI
ncbi:hypothetical protein QBC38DRAFT_490069 [Podospora fimiseda]|uniref:Nephrocystin 3-like N-terminal domain-containing protein n=1 Tax=Podospora fimiseda TaxID=252190 RepID=A0AAN6YTC9_9PEZI|nr:hypothetical protein QBC38DRAFT_490069 [Podospora fimiseda]